MRLDEFTGKKVRGTYGIDEFKKKYPDRFKMDLEMGMEYAGY
jgi:dihydroneopterin aldolase